MPILEAKAVGVPVITSDIEPMSEVGRGYACLVDPDKPEEIRIAITSGLTARVYGVDTAPRTSCDQEVCKHAKLYNRITAISQEFCTS